MNTKVIERKTVLNNFRVIGDDAYRIFEIARENNWDNCEVFGTGDMIGSPEIAMKWKLIPADLYLLDATIPAEGYSRIRTLHRAGVNILGVVVADDDRKPKIAQMNDPKADLVEDLDTKASQLNSVLIKVLIGMLAVAAAAIIISVIVAFIAAILTGLAIVAAVTGAGAALMYDPKLCVLVPDGVGGTIWVSVLTWYD